MFGLSVRFTCKDQASAEAYDRLVAETIEQIKANEPGTIVYASHTVKDEPLQRIFYELYRDKDAFDAHEAAPHTQRYLAERDQYLAVDRGGLADLAGGQGDERLTAPDYQQALGRKIAAERHRRGLSQPELARLIGRSVAWVSQVERGVRRIDRMSVLESLAGALDIPLAELAAEAPVVAAVTEESPAAGDLRLVLSGVHSLKAMLNGHQSPSLDDLRDRTAKAWELTHAGRYADLTDLLRALVPDLETAARALPDDQHGAVFEQMAAAYQACSAALDKLGEPEAAWIAADRAMAAAERAGNPLLVAAGAFRLVFVFMSARHYAQAEETARTAADALWHLADDGNPEAMSLWGALTLQRAITAARTGDADCCLCASRAGQRDGGPARRRAERLQHRVRPGERGAVRDRHRGRTRRCRTGVAYGGRARYVGAVGRAAGPDAHRRGPRSCPAPSGRRGGIGAGPGRGHHPRAGPRSLPGPPDRLRPALHAGPARPGASRTLGTARRRPDT